MSALRPNPVRELAALGRSTYEIAEVFGVAQQSVHGFMVRHGIPRTGRAGPRCKRAGAVSDAGPSVSATTTPQLVTPETELRRAAPLTGSA